MVRFDSFQQLRCWFIGGVLGDEFAGEGTGEERRRELVHLPARASANRNSSGSIIGFFIENRIIIGLG
jgi:hypothetical protein